MDTLRLDNEIAVITGGGTGLGLGMARSMAAAGARVVWVGRRENVLEEAVAQLGDAATFRVFDVTAMDHASELIEAIEGDVGPVSILVHNAGVHLKKPALETTEAEFIQVMRTHVGGAMSLTRATAKGMCERRHGTPRLVYQPHLYQRLLDLKPSRANALEYCIGAIAEMTEGDVYGATDRYARQGAIAYVHCRNVRGKAPNYEEVFIDEGDIDTVRVLRILHRSGFDGVLIPDHTPSVACDAPWHAGMAYALGYLRAALEVVERE